MLACSCLTGCSRLNLRALTHYQAQHPIVTMTLESQEQIIIELYPEEAPNTVNNFISLIEDGYYDGLQFHRMIENYLIQGGDPLMNNYGSPGYSIEGEFRSNGIKNKLKHKKGLVSMARSSDYDSAGSQFFITLQDANMLNGYYAGFGKVIQGMEVVEAICQNLETAVVEKVEVDTGMAHYPDPKIIPLEPK